MKWLTWLLDSASILTHLTTTWNIFQTGFRESLWILLVHSVPWANILKMFAENKIYCAADFCGALCRALQYQYNKLTEITAVLITGKFKNLRLVFRFSKCQWTQLITTCCHGESSQVTLSRPLLSNSKENNGRKILSTWNKGCGQQMPSPALSPLECQPGTRSRRVYSDLTIKPQAFGDSLSLSLD